ncbi:MAG: 8-amino-7-oxononanoate synthase [Myxococcaceae bacterium]|nr:8-amino-7-oxononanoate synthase [Myxococcaceae bacterium]
MAVDPLAHLADHLEQLESAGLRRHTRPAARTGALSFCSNDYLGLASRAAPPVASGSGASRLIAGERDEHRRLERAFATWLGVEDVLAFSSGYAANVGAVSALAGAGDLIVSDALNHASLIDGARLSRARVAVVAHGDAGAVARALADRSEARAWVLVESYYSMDADGPDLGALRALCDAHGAALYVDEAHALGVLGPAGRGRCAEAGVTPDVLVGTLGKAFGSQGAFVAGRSVVREWLWNRARSFVFSTGLAPVSAAVGVRALQEVIEHPELAAHVGDLAARLRAGLVAAVASSAFGDQARQPRVLGFGHVVPVVLGTPARALRWAAWMREHDVDVHAIRPPTVPAGASRIRMTVTAEHRDEDVDRAIDAFAAAAHADASAPVDP